MSGQRMTNVINICMALINTCLTQTIDKYNHWDQIIQLFYKIAKFLQKECKKFTYSLVAEETDGLADTLHYNVDILIPSLLFLFLCSEPLSILRSMYIIKVGFYMIKSQYLA